MKLTSEEKKLIQEKRDSETVARVELALARDALRQLSDEQVVSIARQLAAAYERVTGPQPRCTCDSQWSDPRCPAALAGWKTKNGGPCNQRPAPVACIRVNL